MKKIFVILTIISNSSISLADSDCKGLQNFVGLYKQVSKSCDSDQFGPTLEVSPYVDEREPRTTGYWLRSAGIAFGPTDMDNGRSLDKCVAQKNAVAVAICGNATSYCLPEKGRMSFVFSGPQVTYTADGCIAVYSK